MADQKLNSSKISKHDWLWLKVEIEELLSAKINDVDFFELCGQKRKLAYERGFTPDEYHKAYKRVLYLNRQPKPKPEPQKESNHEPAKVMEESKIDARKCASVIPSALPGQTKPPKRDGSALDRMISEQIEKRKSR